MTPPERTLWRYLRRAPFAGAHFRRQHPVGSYIVDLCSVSRRLVIELDGESHDEQLRYDARRSAWLRREGYRVLRFTNYELGEELRGVLATIARALASGPPP